MIDIFTGEMTPEASLPVSTDLSMDDNNYLSNLWLQPSSDTSVDVVSATGQQVASYNSPGDLPSAIANQTVSTTQPGAPSGYLNSISDAFDKAMADVTSGAVKVGTAAAAGAIGTAIGSANPGPHNTNTNMANKSLLQQAQMMEQQLLGGMLKNAQGKTNYWLVAGMALLAVLIIIKFARR